MKVFLWLLTLLFPPRDSAQTVAHLTPHALVKRMRPGRHVESGIVHLLPYQDSKVRSCIQEAKFHHNKPANEQLAAVFVRYVQRIPEPYVVVPIPLSAKRKQARGYNQVEQVLKAGSIPFSQLLTRVRHTTPQTLIPKENRHSNMKDAFQCSSILSPVPIYVLVDDVTTTGATLKAGEQALLQAGAEKILLVSLAH